MKGRSQRKVIVDFLTAAREFAGDGHVSIRVDAANLETVYLQLRSDVLVLTDLGETWYALASGATATGAWAEERISESLEGRDFDAARELDNGELSRLCIEREVHEEAVSDAIHEMASLLDSLFDVGGPEAQH